jgi:predicted dehydrogenase
VASSDASAGKERLEVLGAGSTAILDDFRLLDLHRAGKQRVIRKFVQDKGHRAEMQAFVEAVRRGRESPINIETIAATSRATFAAVDSLRDGLPRTLG